MQTLSLSSMAPIPKKRSLDTPLATPAMAPGISGLKAKRVRTGGTFSRVCGECGRVLSNEDALRKHFRTHNGDQPFVCDTEGCGRAFTLSGALAVHKRKHTRAKPYICDVEGCLRAFTKSYELTCHKRTHSGGKPFICNVEGCSRAFGRSSRLTVHKRTHSGLKPFRCDAAGCASAFASSGDLTRHKRIQHAGAKPYICDAAGCGRAFGQSSHLISHKRLHSGDKPYTCEHCSHTFAQSSNLRRHLLVHERQSSFQFICAMQDGGTQLWAIGDVACTIRCETAQHMNFHVQRNHTLDGIGAKLESETKLAKFFDANQIPYDRDWVNRIKFTDCKNIEGKSFSARPDFFLPAESARINAIVLVGNDEFAHRQYPCDLQRTHNIVQALGQTAAHRDVPIVYFRFNPHFFKNGAEHFDMPLAASHELLLRTIRRVSGTQLNRPGLNLVYINYDRDENRKLRLFQAAEEEGNDFGAILLPCVIASV